MPVHRTPWNDFPPILTQSTGSALKGDPDYQEAKTGDLRAARGLVARVYQAGKVPAQLKPDFIVPVIQIDVSNRWNAIPVAYAERLARDLGGRVLQTIVQDNIVHHTEAGATQRILLQPSFSGRVQSGRYLIVDDSATLGSTLANLRGFIEHNGGTVAAASTLATAIFSAKLIPDSAVLASIKRRFKNDLEFLQKKLGFGVDCLTSRESYFLNGLANLESLRNRFAPSLRSFGPAH